VFEDLQPQYDPEKELKDLKQDQYARSLLTECTDEIIRQRDHISTLKQDFTEAFADATRFAEHIRDCHKALEEYRCSYQQGDFDNVDLNFDEKIEIDVTNLEEEDN
jgi:hypothetical protein